ncbi:MAG: hypothetical protein ACOYVG_06080 [Bacteroidota bacterium]
MLRTQLKQGYFDAAASGGHENTLMLNEREKTMWSIWNYADTQGKQYKGFQVMAGDYQENSTNVFQTQQQQNASLVTQQWDLRRAELDAARARWENLAVTIENRGTESFNASEQKFLKAWRQWEIDTNRKIDAGKKQWDDKFKTFLTSKQNWQDEIKAAAMEQSLEKMLGATGSALNERLKALSANINIPVDVPEINVANLVQAAMADFERSKPSNERLFGEINKSITAFNVTLELGNATHFKGFNSTSLEGDFASNMETFSKKMAILNNVKMYESFKKLIEDFKESLRKNDTNVTSGLTTAATLANYRQDGGWYTKDMGWAFGGKYGFSAYQHADVDGLMNRGMREAGMTIMSGDEMVSFLEKGRDVDVKLFFEVQTMALEQAFKIVGGDKSKKGLYGEWVGEAPQYNNEGDESNQGSGELGGWAGGQMDNKKTYRGLNKEEKRLSTIQGSITAAMNVTASLAAAATGNVAMLVTLAGAQATATTGAALSQGRDAGGTLAMGAIDFGIAFGGALMGPGVAATAIRSSVGFVRAGIAQNPDGTINLDFKGNWSKGGGAQALFSGAMSVAGEGIGTGVGGGWGKVISAGLDAIGDGMRFDSGGVSGFSVASAAGSLASAWAANNINPGQTESKSTYAGELRKQVMASEIGKLANAVTTTLVGAMTNDRVAANNFVSTYQNVNGFSALGGILGRVVNMRMEENKAVDAARQASKEGGQPMSQELMGALARAVMRRKEEEAESGGEMSTGDSDAGGSPGVDDPVTVARNYFGKAKMDAENIGQINQMLKSGILSDADVKEIAKQQVANNIESGASKNLKLVPTKDFGGFMNTLAVQHKMTPEQVEAMYVLANNPTLDPRDPEAYAQAKSELKAKMSQGGTIAMPAGAGEYTSQTDKKYAPIRQQMREQAEYKAWLAQTQQVTIGSADYAQYMNGKNLYAAAGNIPGQTRTDAGYGTPTNALSNPSLEWFGLAPQLKANPYQCGILDAPPAPEPDILRDPTQLSPAQRSLALAKAMQHSPIAGLGMGVLFAGTGLGAVAAAEEIGTVGTAAYKVAQLKAVQSALAISTAVTLGGQQAYNVMSRGYVGLQGVGQFMSSPQGADVAKAMFVGGMFSGGLGAATYSQKAMKEGNFSYEGLSVATSKSMLTGAIFAPISSLNSLSGAPLADWVRGSVGGTVAFANNFLSQMSAKQWQMSQYDPIEGLLNAGAGYAGAHLSSQYSSSGVTAAKSELWSNTAVSPLNYYLGIK